MNFSSAMKLMENGNPVRIKSWEPKQYIIYDVDRKCFYGKSEYPLQYSTFPEEEIIPIINLSAKQIFSDDWEIYDPEKPDGWICFTRDMEG